MKIQIDLNGDLWVKFRDKVHSHGKTLSEVVPTLFEPALMCYLGRELTTVIETPPMEVTEFDTEKKLVSVQRLIPTVKRCELCDMPTERLHLGPTGQKICYDCWKTATVNSNAMSSEKTSSSVSDPSSPPRGPS